MIQSPRSHTEWQSRESVLRNQRGSFESGSANSHSGPVASSLPPIRRHFLTGSDQNHARYNSIYVVKEYARLECREQYFQFADHDGIAG